MRLVSLTMLTMGIVLSFCLAQAVPASVELWLGNVHGLVMQAMVCPACRGATDQGIIVQLNGN